MNGSMTRRGLVALGAGLGAAAVGGAWAAGPRGLTLTALERTHGGRLGLYALDTGSGRVLAHRADERFLMCSTFKALLAAAVLARVDAGRERLDRRIAYRPAHLLSNSDVSRRHVARGWMTIEEMCAGVVEVSDNTAANLLIDNLGGPGGFTLFMRGLGDPHTRLDRNEPALNRPYGVFDTTTPRAAAGSLRALLLGETLSAASRARLEGWMRASRTGVRRLRAGVPAGWIVGDKTGSGDGVSNDLAILRPPGRAPLLVAAYYVHREAKAAQREAVLAEVGRLAAAWAG
jgi:beta-lactamase class A